MEEHPIETLQSTLITFLPTDSDSISNSWSTLGHLHRHTAEVIPHLDQIILQSRSFFLFLSIRNVFEILSQFLAPTGDNDSF